MIDPYRMVVVNLFALALLISILGIYKFIFKKNIKPIIIVILFSILPIISVFRKGVYESGDFTLQIYRAIDFYNSLTNGIFLPRWGSELNATYGHPVFVFLSNLQYYLISFFHFLGLSYIASAKAVLIIFFILSSVTMFYFVKKYFGEKAATISSIFYLYTPYHLIDLHFRVSYGDIIAFALYPLSFLFASNLLNKYSVRDFVFLSITILLLVISHPITMPAIVFLIIYISFISLIKKTPLKNLLIVYSGVFIGGLMSAFYWLPLVTETKYTHEGLVNSIVTFQNFSELIYSPWRFGLLFQGHYGELSFLLGYAQFLVIALSFILLFKTKKKDYELKILIFLLVSLFAILFLITPYSRLIWENIKIINSIQFSYRLLFITTFVVSFIAGISLNRLKINWIIGLICLFAVASTILNWGNRRTIPEINDSVLIKNLPYSTFQVEGHAPELPIWRDFKNPWMKEIPNDKLEIIMGEAKIVNLRTLPNKSEFLVSSKTPTELKRNIYYFPGWIAKDNGKQIKINYTNDGLIHISLDPGIHKVEFIFIDTFERKLAKIISFFGIFLLFFIVIVNFLIKNKRIN